MSRKNSILGLYDVAIIQWITSCHKNRMTTRVMTLLRVHVTSLTTFISTIEIVFILKAMKSHFEGHMINRILHSWSFHMNFMKLLYEMTTRVRFFIS